MAVARIILYYSDSCGFCQKMKAAGGPWESLQNGLPEDINIEEVDVAAVNYTPFMEGGGVPQIALVDDGNNLVHRQVGYNPDTANELLKIINSAANGGSFTTARRGNGQKKESRAGENLYARLNILHRI